MADNYLEGVDLKNVVFQDSAHAKLPKQFKTDKHLEKLRKLHEARMQNEGKEIDNEVKELARREREKSMEYRPAQERMMRLNTRKNGGIINKNGGAFDDVKINWGK